MSISYPSKNSRNLVQRESRSVGELKVIKFSKFPLKIIFWEVGYGGWVQVELLAFVMVRWKRLFFRYY